MIGSIRQHGLEKMKAGEFISVLEAVQVAGWRKTPTAADRMRTLWEKANDQERQEIAAVVMTWLRCQEDVAYDAVLHDAEKLSDERVMRG